MFLNSGVPQSRSYTITSVSDFLVERSSLSELGTGVADVYRGQAEDKPLQPKIIRYLPEENHQGQRDVLRVFENMLLEEFQRQATPYLSSEPQNVLEWLAVGQHHGLATRLLDWAENPLTALFFAVQDDKKREKNGVVWLLTGIVLREIPRVSLLSNLDDFLEREIGTFIYYPKHINPRFISQQGCFTVESTGQKSPFYWYGLEEPVRGEGNYILTKFNIPAEIKPRIRTELDALGVNYHTLFPDLDGLSHKLNWLFETKSGWRQK